MKIDFAYQGAAVTLLACVLYSTFMRVQEINSFHFKGNITSDMDTKTTFCDNKAQIRCL